MQLKSSFNDKILKFNSVYILLLVKFIIIDNYIIGSNFPDMCTAYYFLSLPVRVATTE